MEDDIILNRPSDRRIVGEENDLQPGPPGVENITEDLSEKQNKQRRSYSSSPSHMKGRHSSRSRSRSRDRKSLSRTRRSPSSSSRRNRRSISRGRDRHSSSRSRGTPNYNRDYSPRNHRRYNSGRGRRSRDRKRSPIRRDHIDRRRDRRSRSRDRYRGRRTPSRSPRPRTHRWSPIAKKPTSPPPPPPPVSSVPMQAPPQFSVPMGNVYNDGYGSYPPQYSGQQFQTNDYSAAMPPPPFTTTYPPPPSWGVVAPPPTEDFSSQSVGWSHAAPVPPPQAAPQRPLETEEDLQKREAAVAKEVQTQREQLRKQRDEYLKRASALKRELKILKQQRTYLVSGDTPLSPKSKSFLDENENLQSQIQKKLNTIENVIDMLDGIIGDEKLSPSHSESSSKKLKTKVKPDDEGKDDDDVNNDDDDDDDSSPERLKTKLIESMKNKKKEKEREKEKEYQERTTIKVKDEFKDKKFEDLQPTKKVNYIFYDPEMHWCEACNVFPKTAKDYLNHLHSQQHKDQIEVVETPWHDFIASDDFPTYPNAATKRAPIRGLQFFVPATGWFCKLCNYWMGDLHCASVHLKSKTHSDECNKFFQQNPHFEVDWMAGRQRKYDSLRAPPPPPQITSVSTTGIGLLESIPLQINTQKISENEKFSLKKRKKKSDEKKEKKKKRKTKKRKKVESSSSSTSSTSSPSSSSSFSENENGEKIKSEKKKIIDDIEKNAQSIRVAMRNLSTKPSNENDRGKWTVIQESQELIPPPPPPPRINTPPMIDPDATKKDEMMMSQWNAPIQPIISESEKKLLEELKGKLKFKPTIEDETRNSSKNIYKKKEERDSIKNKDRTRERDRSRRSRSKDKRSRSRDKGWSNRDKRSRSRKNSRSRGRSPRYRRKSRSPRKRSRSQTSRYSGRRRSYSHSASPIRAKSRSKSKSLDHRVEKPVVRYPEFRPRIPPDSKNSKKNKSEEESERKKSSPSRKKKEHSSTEKKKLPFIGRMPVFKKQPQGNETDKKENENENENSENSTNTVQQQTQLLQEQKQQFIHQQDQIQMSYEQQYYDYDDLMPDPMQYVTLMGAPPPPPSEPPPPEESDEKDILPPGVDETETDLIPKPISDAPIPKKGPLPKDFEEALNIIFPGENKSEENTENKTKEQKCLEDVGNTNLSSFNNEIDIEKTEMASLNTGIMNDDTSQMSVVYSIGNHGELSQDMNGVDGGYMSSVIHMQIPDIYGQDMELKFETMDKTKNSSPTNSEKLRRQEELDDLAMLGIDADDLAAQCI